MTERKDQAMLGFVIVAGSTLFAVLMSSISLDNPVSYIAALDRTPVVREKVALEKGTASSAEDYATPEDTYVSAFRKLWRIEGFLGLCKGFLPHCISVSTSLTIGMISNKILGKLTDSTRNGAWKVINAFLLRATVTLVVSLATNPIAILQTRLRFSPLKRTTRQELQYLTYRLSYTEWILTGLLPTYLRFTVVDITRACAGFLVASLLPVPFVTEFSANFRVSFINNVLSDILGGIAQSVLAHPFRRAEELAMLNVKPMEDSVIPIATYDDLGDELVRDSAWHGVRAGFSHSSLSSMLKIAIYSPLFAILSIMPLDKQESHSS